MSDDTQSYLDFLDEDRQAQAFTAEPWQITYDHEAIWALRKIAQARAHVEARAATVRAEMEQLTAWLEQAQREASRAEAFFEGKLHGYLLRLQAEGRLGRKKSWSLPNGRLQLRTLPARYDVVDADQVLAFATEQEAISVTVTPDMAIIRDMCANGVEVPGMGLARQAMDTFSIHLIDEKGGE